MEINGSTYHLFIDQNYNHELAVTSGNIDLGTTFKDILEAKLLMENGQNIHTIEKNPNTPKFLDIIV